MDIQLNYNACISFFYLEEFIKHKLHIFVFKSSRMSSLIDFHFKCITENTLFVNTCFCKLSRHYSVMIHKAIHTA